MSDSTYIQENILQEFPNMETLDDLLDLLNEVKEFLEEDRNDAFTPLRMNALNYYKNHKASRGKRYKTFSIKKKSGKVRVISAPCAGLKRFQTCLNFILQTLYQPNPNACGFVPGRSVADGAKKHTGKNYVLNIDLKDFFDSIEFHRVKAIFTLPPFNLVDDKENPNSLPYVLANLCCHPKEVTRFDKDGNPYTCIRNVTPQGAPTSPIVTNLICRQMDRRLLGLAKRFKLSYSRYADDITFSSYKKNVFESDSAFMTELKRIIEEDQKFRINEEKTRVQSRGYRQEVTGLVVNSKVNVTKRYVKQIRMWLYLWEHYGYEKASECFQRDYAKNKGQAKRGKHMDNVIEGKLNYMKMIVGPENASYIKLRNRFDKLKEINDSGLNVSAILDVWETKGLEKAINLYEKTVGCTITNDYMKSKEHGITHLPESEISIGVEMSNGNRPNYTAFINGLLNSNTFSKADKKRVVNLLLKEKIKGYMTEEQVRQLIEQYKFTTEDKVERMIEQKVGTGISSNNDKESTDVFVHNPKNMVSFLSSFSKDDDLKWFTHDPDQPNFVFNYAKYVLNAKKSFDKKAKGINPSTWYNTKNFVFNTNEKAKDDYNRVIKFRWKDLEEWCVEHSSQHPFNTLVDDYKFSRYIEIFKNTIEFRSKPKFSDRVEDFIYDVALNTPDIKLFFTDAFYSSGGQLSVYVDIRQLFAAIKEMGKWIVDNKSKGNKVEISVEENQDSFILTIFHINSYMNIGDEKLKGLSGDFHKVRNILLNVADWSIDADINNKPLHIECLGSTTKYTNNRIISENKIEPLSHKVNGVKHFIKLYKDL